ncbi:hypothetical protein [Azospirillum sp. TSA2s]|uniref:hypothetical protein n=1 Tax=Azospirillum sp. TSA2s TaxID=709810 RepID=UPI00145B8F96|nr:hypothetical protein [Azospirillum sp. TSA2s]
MSRPSITEEERAWIVLSRSFDSDFRTAFLAAAEDIAAGRKPRPYRPMGDGEAHPGLVS